MSIIIDIVILLIIAACIYGGYKKGLIGVAFSIISFLIAILVAIILVNPITNIIIENSKIDENIQEAIINNLAGETEQNNASQENTNGTSEVIINYINEYTNDIKTAGVNTIAQQLSTTVIKICVFLVLFLGTKILLVFFKALANVIAKLPILKQFNKLGGLVYGTIKGLLIIYILLAIVSLIAPIVSSTEFFEAMNTSWIGSYLYNHNLILKLLF